ncbi:MAG: hypothetical protein LBU36_06685 [Clostridiales bacterium]|jgi:hypothetical protein|nr:hypothetical protein [Clostridiales bacterium]
MESKTNKIIAGVILLLIGLMSMSLPGGGLNGRLAWTGLPYAHFMTTIFFLCGGFGFLLMYKNKRKNWSLGVGVYMVYMAVLAFPNLGFGLAYLRRAVADASFFIAPGVIFLILYFDKAKRRLLLPGCLLTCFGAGRLLVGLTTRGLDEMGVVLLSLGIGFLTAHSIGRLKRGVQLAGYILTALGGFYVASGIVGRARWLISGLPQIGASALIAVGGLLILGAFSKKPDGGAKTDDINSPENNPNNNPGGAPNSNDSWKNL